MIYDHFNIKANRDEIEKEREFLCKIFDLEAGYRPNFSDEGYWLYQGDRVIFHLSIEEHNKRNDSNSYFDHIAFSDDNFEELTQRLIENGVSFKTDYVAEIEITQLKFFSALNVKFEIQFAGDYTVK